MEKETFTIAVISPDLTARTSLARTINRMGYSTVPIISFPDDLTKYDPDLAIIDSGSVSPDIIVTCRHARQHLTRYTPILVLASCMKHQLSCIEAGADKYLLKPCRLDDLADTLRMLLLPFYNLPAHHRGWLYR